MNGSNVKKGEAPLMIKRIAKFTVVFVAALAAFAYAVTETAAAPSADIDESISLVSAIAQRQEKVYICHAVGGDFNLLHITERSLRGHANHPNDTDPTLDPQVCPGATCPDATISGATTFMVVWITVDWTNSDGNQAANDYFFQVGTSSNGPWSPDPAHVVSPDASGNYSATAVAPPGAVWARIEADCGNVLIQQVR